MFSKYVIFLTLGSLGIISAAFASPKQLITHNNTSVESNAFIDGVIASQHPTKAHTDNKVFWASVKVACYGRVINNSCNALIKMETDTANPVELGWVSMNLVTGEILPKTLIANGYRLDVNAPGETTLSNAP
jgi:hypothetical protein